MKATKVNHSKVKSSGLLFELLVRQITADTLSNREKSPALSILRKYFAPSTELGKELQLYRAFQGNRRISEAKALMFIDIVCNQRKRLDERKLAREKYNLIRDIKNTYPLKEFLGSRIPDYTLNASIYKVFAAELADGDIENVKDVANAKFTLVEYLTTKPKSQKVETSSLIDEFKNQSQDMRNLILTLETKKFNEKYSNLDNKQKSLLREFIHSADSSVAFYDYVKTEIPTIKKQLLVRSKKIRDKVQAIKLQEVAAQLDKIGAQRKVIKDNEVSALLYVYEILRELKDE